MIDGIPSRAGWIAAVPAVGIVALLALLAETARAAGHHGTGNFLSVAQLLVYFAWFRIAWRASRDIANPWRSVAQGALAAGLALSALL